MLHLDNISSIGEESGLARLDEFFSFDLDEAIDLLAEVGASQVDVEATHKEDWFGPELGRALIKDYMELIRDYHSLSDTTKKQCLADLEEYEKVFDILVQEKIRWHFSYDI